MYESHKNSRIRIQNWEKIILRSDDLNTFYDFVIDKLINEADDFERKESE